MILNAPLNRVLLALPGPHHACPMRLISLLVTLVLVAPALADDAWTPVGQGWSRYTNERFGTKIEVPLHLFKLVDPPPMNGDGRRLASKDGARLWIYGSHGPYSVTEGFEDYKRWLLDGAEKDGIRVTYKAEGNGWIAYSGMKDATITYTKVIEGCEVGHHLTVEYPASKKRLYDPIVTRMSRSLRCRTGLDATDR